MKKGGSAAKVGSETCNGFLLELYRFYTRVLTTGLHVGLTSAGSLLLSSLLCVYRIAAKWVAIPSIWKAYPDKASRRAC